MRLPIALSLLLVGLIQVQAQETKPLPHYQPLVGKNTAYSPYVQYKNYYLLTLIQQLPEWKKAISADKELKQLLQNKLDKAKTALKTCKTAVTCYAQAIKFSEEEITTVSDRLANLYAAQPALSHAIKPHLLPSGYYGLYQNLPEKALLLKAWEQDAKAINYAIGVYVEGNKPNYPKIDSIAFNLNDKEFAGNIQANLMLNTSGDQTLFFEPSMNFALGAMEINGRTEAADYEPLAAGANANALAEIKKTNFTPYPYGVILVPGAGPEDRETELSAGGMLRCRIAALQYQKGMAPFLVVSGGRVHPYKTKYSEAYEMKKFMINVLHIPEKAIIMEPHARHTTTNLRNCVRLMFRYGMPINKPGLVSTTAATIPYIAGVLAERCKKELGYEPYTIGKKLSDTEVEFYPNSLSLQIDFDEPLDP